MRRSARLFELIQILRDGRLHRAQDMAARLEVSVRAFVAHRDLQQGRGVNKFHRGGQMHVVGPVVATHLRTGERKHGPQPLTTRFHQMRSHLGNAWRVFAGHPRADQGVHVIQLGRQNLGQSFMWFRRGVI